MQAFVAYWFSLRFGVGPEVVGPLLFAANLLAAASYLLADRATTGNRRDRCRSGRADPR